MIHFVFLSFPNQIRKKQTNNNKICCQFVHCHQLAKNLFILPFFFQCPHDLGKTKLDSIEKVVDLIRTVSRDISPDPTSKDCDCYHDFYQEKENQTDDAMCQSVAMEQEYDRKYEAQQAEIEMLNAELDKKVCE